VTADQLGDVVDPLVDLLKRRELDLTFLIDTGPAPPVQRGRPPAAQAILA
jgi:hypothetical protein